MRKRLDGWQLEWSAIWADLVSAPELLALYAFQLGLLVGALLMLLP